MAVKIVRIGNESLKEKMIKKLKEEKLWEIIIQDFEQKFRNLVAF